MPVDTKEQEAGETVDESEEFLEPEEDFTGSVIEEERVERVSNDFDYNPPSERSVLGKVSGYGEEVAMAVMDMDESFSTSQIVDAGETRVSRHWAKDILEEMADAGMIEKQESANLLDKNAGVYSPENFTEEDIEEFVETYRQELEYL